MPMKCSVVLLPMGSTLVRAWRVEAKRTQETCPSPWYRWVLTAIIRIRVLGILSIIKVVSIINIISILSIILVIIPAV